MSEERELVNVYFVQDIEDDSNEKHLAVGNPVYNYPEGTILRIVECDDEDEDYPYDTSVICHMTIWKDGEEYAMLERMGRILLGQSKMHRVKARQVYIDD